MSFPIKPFIVSAWGNEELAVIERDLRVIGSLPYKGKFMVVKGDLLDLPYLKISPGDGASFSGKVIQSTSRTFENLFGYADANQKAVLERLKEIGDSIKTRYPKKFSLVYEHQLMSDEGRQNLLKAIAKILKSIDLALSNRGNVILMYWSDGEGSQARKEVPEFIEALLVGRKKLNTIFLKASSHLIPQAPSPPRVKALLPKEEEALKEPVYLRQ